MEVMQWTGGVTQRFSIHVKGFLGLSVVLGPLFAPCSFKLGSEDRLRANSYLQVERLREERAAASFWMPRVEGRGCRGVCRITPWCLRPSHRMLILNARKQGV